MNGPKKISLNTIFNLSGQGTPLIAAFFAIPAMIRNLGDERFGVFMLVWAIIGYCNLFDAGLGRAMTKEISHALATGEQQKVPSIFWSAITMMLLLGIMVSVILVLLSSYIVGNVIKPGTGYSEIVASFRLLSLSLPFVIVTSGLVGFLQSHGKFKMLNSVRAPLGVYSYLAPMLVSFISNSLITLTVVLLIGRITGALIHYIQCVRIDHRLSVPIMFNRQNVIELLSLGGWMTLSNIVSPMMTYLDRFFVSSVVSVAAVTYYATPYEGITKFWQFPIAVSSVYFPIFSQAHATSKSGAVALLKESIYRMVFLVFPVMTGVIFFANDLMTLWLGAAYVGQSANILRILALGMMGNCLAFMPFAYLQAIGRPQVNAKLHLWEVPFYVLLLWLLLHQYGIIGAAVAWTVRVLADYLLLLLSVQCESGQNVSSILLGQIVPFAVAMCGFLSIELPTRIVLMAVVMACYVILWLVGRSSRRFGVAQ